MRQHTPLPWKASVTKYFGKSESEQEVVVHNGDVSICTLAASRGHVEEAMPDALFIARAVNAHDELVATLKAFPGFTDDATIGDAWIERVRAVVASAEGKR